MYLIYWVFQFAVCVFVKEAFLSSVLIYLCVSRVAQNVMTYFY